MTGAFETALLIAVFGAVALHPLIPRHSSPFNLQFAMTWWINEAPLVGLWWLIAGTLGTLLHPMSGFWWSLVAALTAADVLMLGWIMVRARTARPALSQALKREFGPDATPRYTWPEWWRLILPIISWRPDVRRVRNLRYGPERRGNRLDVYHSRRRASEAPAPVLVYFHGALSSKLLGSHPLIYRLASQGWVCVSAGRRQFAAHADQLADTRAALAWVRENAAVFGGDPRRIVAAGGSAGADLAATAALTGSDVAAVIVLYGYFGPLGAGSAPTPPQVVGPDAPPFLIVHGRLDTLVPSRQARAFAATLRDASSQPVVYAELPGTQHSFDVFHSMRFQAVTDAVVRFAELTVGADEAGGSPRAAPSAAESVEDGPDERAEALYYALRTFRRDGSPAGTPIWLAPAHGRWYAYTPGQSWKVKRIRNNPHVEVAASDFHGSPLGPWRPGGARILNRGESASATRALTAKYGRRFRLFRLITLLGALRRHGGQAVGLEISLSADPLRTV